MSSTDKADEDSTTPRNHKILYANNYESWKFELLNSPDAKTRLALTEIDLGVSTMLKPPLNIYLKPLLDTAGNPTLDAVTSEAILIAKEPTPSEKGLYELQLSIYDETLNKLLDSRSCTWGLIYNSLSNELKKQLLDHHADEMKKYRVHDNYDVVKFCTLLQTICERITRDSQMVNRHRVVPVSFNHRNETFAAFISRFEDYLDREKSSGIQYDERQKASCFRDALNVQKFSPFIADCYVMLPSHPDYPLYETVKEKIRMVCLNEDLDRKRRKGGNGDSKKKPRTVRI